MKGLKNKWHMTRTYKSIVCVFLCSHFKCHFKEKLPIPILEMKFLKKNHFKFGWSHAPFRYQAILIQEGTDISGSSHLLLTTTLHNSPHFTSQETGTEMPSDLPKPSFLCALICKCYLMPTPLFFQCSPLAGCLLFAGSASPQPTPLTSSTDPQLFRWKSSLTPPTEFTLGGPIPPLHPSHLHSASTLTTFHRDCCCISS